MVHLTCIYMKEGCNARKFFMFCCAQVTGRPSCTGLLYGIFRLPWRAGQTIGITGVANLNILPICENTLKYQDVQILFFVVGHSLFQFETDRGVFTLFLPCPVIFSLTLGYKCLGGFSPAIVNYFRTSIRVHKCCGTIFANSLADCL